MEQKPHPLSPKACFVAGLVIAILLSVFSTPLPAEAQTIGTALFAAVIGGLTTLLIFWFVVQRKPEVLFLLFCAMNGNIIGRAGFELFQGFSIMFIIVRVSCMLVLVGCVYQYFAKKIKKTHQ